MLFAPVLCQLHLLLAFPQGGEALRAEGAMAVRARDAGLECRLRPVGRADRHAAGMAELIAPLSEAVADRDPVVENEALTLPQAVRLGHGLKIFQYATLEMVDLVQTCRPDIGGGLFAAYAAGAEHGDARRSSLGLEPGPERIEPGWKIPERGGVRINRPLKGAERDLVMIARIDDDRVGVGNQVIPGLGADIIADQTGRVGLRHAHGDNFLLQPHFQPEKRHLPGGRDLGLQVGAARQRLQGSAQGIPVPVRGRQRAIDPLPGQQNGALDPETRQIFAQRRLQRRRVLQRDKFIEGKHAKFWHDGDMPERTGQGKTRWRRGLTSGADAVTPDRSYRGLPMTTEGLKSLDELPMALPEALGGQSVYEAMRQMRARAPFARTEIGITLALRNRHIALMTSDATRQIETETKLLQGITEGPIFEFTRLAMLFANGDVHRRRRTPVARTFAFKLMDAMRPKVRDITEQMVRDRLGAGPVNFVDEIAAQLPARIIAGILGIPDSDIPVFLTWIQDTASALGFVDPANRDRIDASLKAFNTYVEELLEARRKSPREDFLTDYVAATEAAGNLDPGEIRTQILGLILAGSDTTRGSMCMTLSELLQHPDQWQDFVADPDGLKRGVVEEGLRFQPVVSGIPRVLLRDLDVDGVRLPEGSVVAVSLVSALRDPDVFADPDRFNIHRTDQQKWHYAFGAGAHRCVGEALARAEMEEALATIARLAPATRLVGPPPKLGFGAIRPISAMQVAFEA